MVPQHLESASLRIESRASIRFPEKGASDCVARGCAFRPEREWTFKGCRWVVVSSLEIVSWEFPRSEPRLHGVFMPAVCPQDCQRRRRSTTLLTTFAEPDFPA